MDAECSMRLSMLRERRVPHRLFEWLYGLSADDPWLRDYASSWVERAFHGVSLFDGSTVDRHAFELFLQALKLAPLKLAAAQLGMTRESLLQVLEALERIIRSQPAYREIVSLGDVQDIHRDTISR